VETAGAEQRVVPAFVQDDEPLDEGEGEDELAHGPRKQPRLQRQGDAQGRGRGDTPHRQRTREVRGPEMLEFRWAWSGRLHDSSLHTG
jgi:hypothetical protein